MGEARIADLRDPQAGKMIEAAAMEAARKSRFAPAELNGRPFKSGTQISFRFAPTISIELIAPTEFHFGDSVLVTAVVKSDVLLRAVDLRIAFPEDPHEGIRLRGDAPRAHREWSVSLFPARPVSVAAHFTAVACGRDSIEAYCIHRCHPEEVTRTFLPVCIRGFPGSHLDEYRAYYAGDTTLRGFRVDGKIFAQRQDPCCEGARPHRKE